MRNYPFRYNIYTKKQIDNLLDEIESELPDMTDYYTKSETDTLLGNKQNTLTAGDNIAISDNVISATDTKYTAGTGISISDENVISSQGASYTAGDGISISNNVIKVSNDWEKIESDYYDKIVTDSNNYDYLFILKDGNNNKGFIKTDVPIISLPMKFYMNYINPENNMNIFATLKYSSNQLKIDLAKYGIQFSNTNSVSSQSVLIGLDDNYITSANVDDYIDVNTGKFIKNCFFYHSFLKGFCPKGSEYIEYFAQVTNGTQLIYGIYSVSTLYTKIKNDTNFSVNYYYLQINENAQTQIEIGGSGNARIDAYRRKKLSLIPSSN